MMIQRLLWPLFVCVASASVARGDVRLPAIFSDHMVVQAGAAVPVWGWAEPGEEVSVSLGEQTRQAHAAADGRWSMRLDKLAPAAEPQTLTARGRNTITVHDVLVGEVWLCSGQSNMEMQLRGLHGEVDRADEEIAAADYPQIRLFVHGETYDIYAVDAPPPKPLADRPGQWIVCSPPTAAAFTAIGYFFAREVHQSLNVPVGIVCAAVGGTPIEAWTSLESQQAQSTLAPLLDDWRAKLASYDPAAEAQNYNAAKLRWLKERAAARSAGRPDPKAPPPFKNLAVMAPGGLSNALIAPLAPYAVRGVLWYQGERNAAGPFTTLYGKQLTTLIDDWRMRWHDELYFAWVQLPRLQKAQRLPSEPNGWGVAVREGMRQTLALPRTGMAITIDLGGPTDGHPTNKAEYAHRLALLALHDVYHQPIAEWSGPLFRSAERDGDTMVLTFDHADGLRAASGALKGFAIASDDQKFVWAEARIDGPRVIVSSKKVQRPAAVRYGWAANPDCNLINSAGLPASPFRTDDRE
ncbi:MAG TPA: sialate O-acetylesterase [Pirellulales bacterium]|nr:sialate O-acetylesterase [Pirellulales bacterium]